MDYKLRVEARSNPNRVFIFETNSVSWGETANVLKRGVEMMEKWVEAVMAEERRDLVKLSELPGIDITGGIDSADYVQAIRNGELPSSPPSEGEG